MTSYDVYHGTGNDFAVVDADEQVEKTAFGTDLCRSLDVDGTLFLGIEDGGERATMTLVQPDGSRAAMCGNGARCAAKWVSERTGRDVVTLETGAGPRRCTVEGDVVTVEMGTPAFDPDDVPLAREAALVDEALEGYDVTAVNTGVPHAVTFVDDVDAVDLAEMAPPIRHHEVFPEGANVNLAAPTEHGFDQRTYERGVEGETQACGTGAVAIAVVASRLGLAPETGEVTVSPPGGDLAIGLREDGTTTLRGPTERMLTGEVSDA
ncbi:diaminopimelate epimerase [Halarchaeum rubridurum]|uniref:Diaminopimelate epimerase n=1 Tax=Halarchaeum rubridurum TaxID=489911 RepID=A0A830G1K8_9EURY|nr:diaminopimelate epimerase [Halarchaeum rubridurum]MBP1955306.1 diaminopimelate epimerase [Halarchaeum rubridurum]GGM71176.1 diaminopimelate epimerase [Halarchaeum rubridurum]